MAINRVQEAVEEYQRVVKQAAAQYEEALRKAELDMRSAISQGSPEPPNENSIVIDKTTWNNLQRQLDVVQKFLKDNPDLKI